MVEKMLNTIVKITMAVIGTGMMLMILSFLLALGPIGALVALVLGGLFLRISRADGKR